MNYIFEKDDKFNRKKIAENIAGLLISNKNFSPILIDGQWGIGKTYFCNLFSNYIKSNHDNKFEIVHIDAYKFDYTDDPLSVLIGSLTKISNQENERKLLRQAIPLIKVAGKISGRFALSWLLRTTTETINDNVQKAIKDSTDSIIDDDISDLIDKFANIESNILSLQETLRSIAKKKHLIIILDELDRCKPSFALEFIEKVKHIFDVEGINFIFSANMKQLEYSTNHLYGNGIESNAYLKKFFKTIVKLPEVHNNEAKVKIINSEKYFEYLLSENQIMINNDARSKIFIKRMISIDNPSLRDMEDFIRQFKLLETISPNVHKVSDQMNWLYKDLLFFAIYLNHFHPVIIEKLLKRSLDISDIKSIFSIDQTILESPNGEHFYVRELFLFILLLEVDKIKNILSEEVRSISKVVIGNIFRNINPFNDDDFTKIIIEVLEYLKLFK